MIEIHSAQELLQGMQSSFTPAEAEKLLPEVQGEYRQHILAVDQAQVRVHELEALMQQDGVFQSHLHTARIAQSNELTKLVDSLRAEHFSLLADFALIEQSQRVAQLENTVRYLDNELDFHAVVKTGADRVALADAYADLAACQANEAHSAALISELRTVSALTGVLAEEGVAGIIGQRTLELRQAARAADKRTDQMRDAAREARQTYEAQLQARAARGIITAGQTRFAR